MENCTALDTFSVCEREQDRGHPASLAFFSFLLVFSIVIQITLQYFNIIGTSEKQAVLSQAQGASLFGIFTGLSFLLLYFFLSWVKILFTRSQDFISGLLLIFGSIVALSTLIKPVPHQTWFYFWSDLIHSFPFTGLIGILGTTLMIGIWQGCRNFKGPKTVAFLAVHFGALVFLVGTGVTSAFGIHGILNMHEGESASAFLPLANQRPIREAKGLPAQIKLLDFNTEYYTEQHELRVYRHNKGAYDPIQSLEKDKQGFYSVGSSTIEVVNFYPEFSVDTKIMEQPAGTPHALSGGFITVSKGSEQQSDWVFATEGQDGYLKGDGVLIAITRNPLKEAQASLLRFQEEDSPSLPSQTLLISAKEKAYLLLAQGRKSSQAISFKKLPWNISLDNLRVTIEKLHPDILVETTYKSLSDSPKNPVMEINVATGRNDPQPYLLAAGKPQPIPLGDDKFLLFETTPAQPKLFKSLVQVIPHDTNIKPTTHEVMVNHPLSLGDTKIYQADFRKEDPTFSGFSVTYDPGRKIVMIGFALMALGILTHLFVMSLPKEKAL